MENYIYQSRQNQSTQKVEEKLGIEENYARIH
jgi:hypothetical protein